MVAGKQRHFMKADAARSIVAALSAYDTASTLAGRLEVPRDTGAHSHSFERGARGSMH